MKSLFFPETFCLEVFMFLLRTRLWVRLSSWPSFSGFSQTGLLGPFFLLFIYFFLLLEYVLIKLHWKIKIIQGRYTFAFLIMYLLYPSTGIIIWLHIEYLVESHFPQTSDNYITAVSLAHPRVITGTHLALSKYLFIYEWMDEILFQNSF